MNEAVTQTYKGDFYLSFERHDSYKARINRCTVTENNIVFDFKGHDEDRGNFEGGCRLKKATDGYKGSASFRFLNETEAEAASVIIHLIDKDKKTLYLEGLWQDQNDLDPYELSIDLDLLNT